VANLALPLFIMTVLLVIFLISSGVFKTILLYLGIISQDKEIEVDEKLGNYFNCLSNNIRKGWLIEELH
jgi:ABC-type microcin C transport system permease subunit YejB